MKLRILADDLTGALDSAAAFEGEVPVFLDRPGESDAAVSAVATATRDVAPRELSALLAPSLAWLRDADLAFKKIDSLLRGNTFAECAEVAQGFERVVFAPAFPAQGRVTTDGRAWVVQPGSSAMQPIGERSIADAFAPFDLPDLWVPDVRSDDDLRRIAALSLDAAARRWLWCGSAGLAHAIARAHGLAARPTPIERSRSRLLVVSASHHAVLQRQWARLAEAASSLHEVSLRALAPSQTLTSDAAAALLERQVRELVASEPAPSTLVVVGGDTLRALCRAAGATGLRSSASPRAGWGRARLIGGRWDGALCHSRSGAFGADDDLMEIVRALMPA